MSGFWDDAEVISVYTRAEAIADGVLVDVTEAARKQRFVVPVAITCTAWNAYVENDLEIQGGANTESGKRLLRIHALLRQAYSTITESNETLSEDLHYFTAAFSGTNTVIKNGVPIKMHIGPGDKGEPVLTIMLPHED